jgi:hypothetical protein
MDKLINKLDLNRCLVIKNLLESEFPNDKFILDSKNDLDMVIKTWFENPKGRLLHEFIVTNCTTWNEAKDSFTKAKDRITKITNSGDQGCPICFEKCFTNFCCKGCGNAYCMGCYFSIMYENGGLVSCPFCRMESGARLTRDEIMETMRQFIEWNRNN